jgi:hypothetical protein
VATSLDTFDPLINAAADRAAERVATRLLSGQYIKPKVWLTRTETRERLDVADDTFTDWIAAGKAPPSVGKGRMRRWHVDVIDKHLAEQGGGE